MIFNFNEKSRETNLYVYVFGSCVRRLVILVGKDESVFKERIMTLTISERFEQARRKIQIGSCAILQASQIMTHLSLSSSAPHDW